MHTCWEKFSALEMNKTIRKIQAPTIHHHPQIAAITNRFKMMKILINFLNKYSQWNMNSSSKCKLNNRKETISISHHRILSSYLIKSKVICKEQAALQNSSKNARATSLKFKTVKVCIQSSLNFSHRTIPKCEKKMLQIKKSRRCLRIRRIFQFWICE